MTSVAMVLAAQKFVHFPFIRTRVSLLYESRHNFGSEESKWRGSLADRDGNAIVVNFRVLFILSRRAGVGMVVEVRGEASSGGK